MIKGDLAKKVYQRNLEIRQKTQGKQHVSCVCPHTGLGLIYLKRNNISKALFHFGQVLQLCQKDRCLGEGKNITTSSD